MTTAAIMVGRQNRYIENFRKGGAISKETAKTLQELDILDSFVLSGLVRRGVVVECPNRRFYLEEARARQFVGERRTRLLLVLFVVAAAVVAGLVASR